MKKISVELLSRAILAAGLAGAVIAPSFATAAKPKNVFTAFIDLIDQTTGDFCQPEVVAVTPNSEKVYVAANDFVTGYAEVFALNALDDTITASVILDKTADQFAFGVAIDPAGSFAYVSVEGTTSTSGRVYIVRTADNAVVPPSPLKTTIVGPFPEGLAVSPNGKDLWIANSGTVPAFDNGTVTVVQISNLTPVNLIPTGGSPDQVVFSPTGARVYALNGNPLVGYVSVINARTENIINNTFGLGVVNFPFYSLSVGAGTISGKQVFVANFSTSVVNLNANGTVKTIYNMFLPSQTDTDLGQPAVTTNGKFLYVAEPEAGAIGWVNLVTNTVEALTPVFVGGEPYFIAVSPNGDTLYEADLFFDGVGVIDIQQ
jgi:DNA-binding beta-propeller fold protein YncE